MSIELMTIAWKLPCDTHTQKLVLIALADNANDDGVCWPSINKLATKCSLSRQGVIDQIDALEIRGWVKRNKNIGRSTHYQLSLVNAVDWSNGTGQPHGLPPVNGVDYHQSTRLTTPVNGVDSNHQEPSGEPKEEPSASPSKPKRERKPKNQNGEAWVESQKDNPLYSGLNLPREVLKMKTWLSTRPHRTLSADFARNWLDRAAETSPRGETRQQPKARLNGLEEIERQKREEAGRYAR